MRAMNRAQRIATILAGLAAVIIAFVVLSPDDEEPGGGTTAPPITQTVPAPTEAQGTTPQATTPKAPAATAAPLLTRGRVREIKVQSGEIVRFRVRSSVPEEIHVHGYDITSPVEAGGTTRLAFKARLEGIFEIELHRAGEPIGRLVVEP